MNPATEELTGPRESTTAAEHSQEAFASTGSPAKPSALENHGGGLAERSRIALLDGQGGRWQRWLVGAIVLVGFCGAAAFGWTRYVESSQKRPETGWLTEDVRKSRLLVTVTEDGNVESASNVDVKCEVAGGSTILWIVEDGERVVAGQEIVKLDQSTIDEQLNAQKIVHEKALATKIQAEQDYEAAKIAVDEYLEGTFKLELQTLMANVTIALENQRAAQNALEHTRRMFRKGFVTSLQLEADEFAVKRSDLEVLSAETARDVLQKFTRQKMITELQSTRDAAAARMRSEQASEALELQRKEKLIAMREKCTIVAPQAGMVVYANSRSSRGRSEVLIEEGAAVREGQTMIRLPDLARMQVRVNIHESQVEKITAGVPARIVVQGREYYGKVASVANQPESKSFFSADVKEYAAIVAIEGEIFNVKPGMTAEVTIFVADIKDQLTVPVECVVEQNGKFYVWVLTDKGPERRPALLGETNDKVIAIRDGVAEGEKVLRNPRAVIEEAREDSDLPAQEKSELPSGIPDKITRPGKDAKKKKKSGSSTGGGSQLPATITSLDKDADGKLSKSEVPAFMQNFFDRVDTDSSGFVETGEWAAFRKKAAERSGEAGGAKGGPPVGGGA